MPNGVADAGRVALVCWALATFTLLNWLAIRRCEVPEVGHRLVDAAHKVIVDCTLVVNAAESMGAHTLERVPKSALRRCESLRWSTLKTAGLSMSLQMRQAAGLRNAAPALILCVKVCARLSAGFNNRVVRPTTANLKGFVSTVWYFAICVFDLSHAIHACLPRRSP